MKHAFTLMTAIAAAVVLVACPPGDVRLDVTPHVVIHYFDRPDSQIQTVDAGAYFDMEYTWKVGPDFAAPNRDLRAFVHFRDSTGNLIVDDSGKTVQDDHDFKVAIRDWKSGEDQVYTRKRLKFNEDLGSRNYLVNLYVGMYDPNGNQRAELKSPDGEAVPERAYLMSTFIIRKNPKIYPRFNETWHGPEPAPNDKHRWSRRESYVTFLRDSQAPAAELWISGHSPVEDLETKEQRMWIYIHEQKPEFLVTAEPFVFTGERLELTQIPIPTELYQTYTDRDIRIIFVVDQVLMPPQGDARDELGFRVQELLLLPRNLER